MPKNHIVRDGEHLAYIAHINGFQSWKSVYQHQDNQALQKTREPHTLMEGDSLVIPDKVKKTVTIATGQQHKFKLKHETVKLKLKFKSSTGDVFAEGEYKFSADFEEQKGSTDNEGFFEADIKPKILKAECEVLTEGRKTPLRWGIQVGALAPIEKEAGWLARLANLGYYRQVPNDVESRERRSAIEEFECDNGLKITGEMLGKTIEKLKEIYGC